MQIKKIESLDQKHECAQLMTSSEPWITLERTYEESLYLLSDATKEIYIAQIDDQMVGFIILSLTGAFCYIQTICIKPEHRGKGLGSELIDFAEKRIFKESPNVFMSVSSFNLEAQKLYKRLGYEVVGELKDYIITGYSEIFLRKTIGTLKDFYTKQKIC